MKEPSKFSCSSFTLLILTALLYYYVPFFRFESLKLRGRLAERYETLVNKSQRKCLGSIRSILESTEKPLSFLRRKPGVELWQRTNGSASPRRLQLSTVQDIPIMRSTLMSPASVDVVTLSPALDLDLLLQSPDTTR